MLDSSFSAVWINALRQLLKALIKLHFKIWRWFYPGHVPYCRLGRAHSKLCWVSLHSTQPTFFGGIAKCETQQRPISKPSPWSFFLEQSERLRPAAALVCNCTQLDRIYRIIRIILFYYCYILSILLILSENETLMLLSFLFDQTCSFSGQRRRWTLTPDTQKEE